MEPFTRLVAVAQSSWSRLGDVVESVQAPGPCRGMSTTRSAELTRPSSSPLATFTLELGTVGLTVESVTKADEVFCARVVVVFGASVVDVTGTVVVVGASVVEVTGTVVVVLARVEVPKACATFTWWCAAGVVFELVSVNTRTRSKRGLDHIKR
jgi:hypothetical protein